MVDSIDNLKLVCLYHEASYVLKCKDQETIKKEIRDTFEKEGINTPSIENYKKQMRWYILWEYNIDNKANFSRGGIGIQFERPEDMDYFFENQEKLFPTCKYKKFSDVPTDSKLVFTRNPKYAA